MEGEDGSNYSAAERYQRKIVEHSRTRIQRKVRREHAKVNPNYTTDQMFSYVYEHENSDESRQTIYYDWDYEEFLSLYNTLQYTDECRYAQQLDSERESQAQQNTSPT